MKQFVTRKNHRLQNYNYSSNGSYFITICVKNKECMLGDVVGGDVLSTPKPINKNDIIYLKSKDAKMVLSEYGKIVQKYIEEGKNKLKNLTIDNYVIMPNHIHLIISLHNNDFLPDRKPCHDIIPSYVAALKSLITKEIGFSMFQRDYHDHIVRNEKEYEKIWNYIETNESNWVADRFYMY